jgi:hypothetical protein
VPAYGVSKATFAPKASRFLAEVFKLASLKKYERQGVFSTPLLHEKAIFCGLFATDAVVAIERDQSYAKIFAIGIYIVQQRHAVPSARHSNAYFFVCVFCKINLHNAIISHHYFLCNKVY